MGMISSEALAKNLGVSHKQVKSLILKYDVRAVPSGSSFMDAGKPQRKVLEDEEAFNDWYDSDDYNKIKPIRLANSNGEVHLLEEANLSF